MSTTAQRRRYAIEEMERRALDLLQFVETYDSNAVNSQGYHRSKRHDPTRPRYAGLRGCGHDAP